MSATAKRTGRPQADFRGPGRIPVRLNVNGEEREIFIEPRRTLLDALRKDLGLTGTKKGCDEGTCGACTVIVDGRSIYSCMALAVEFEGKSIETIENLGKGGVLHPIQTAFVEEDGFQCGFCTPGQVMSAKALLDSRPRPSGEEIARAMEGNLCRCGAYSKIARAVHRAGALSGRKTENVQGPQDEERV
ncbi:MAG TPA: (2Fe-2S)-binding protein [Thermodesulfobacteriota bacterium]|nr:(2Fe-2S)-binding protein [Thermodesulfobacteriota bacterium]